ncbi:MAG: phage major capsid protein [Pseudomonadota bacterium]
MLTSVRLARRQSEIRERLSILAAKDDATEDETRELENLDGEYRSNETRYRAALVAEDDERREAGAELETRSDREWSDLCGNFKMVEVARALTEHGQLAGQTAEVVEELRSQAGFAGIPVPLEALEIRVGETVASGTPDPITTRPIVDRLFSASVAQQMGASFVSIPAGATEWPITTSSVTASWADGETADVGGPTAFTTTDRPLRPDHTLGIQVKLTRKAMKQSGAALETAMRRDVAEAMRVEMDRAVFLGSGASGQPTGVFNISGLTSTAIDAAPSFDVFLEEVTQFMISNTITSADQIRLLMRPEIFKALHAELISGTATTVYDRVGGLFLGRSGSSEINFFPRNMNVSSNAVAAPTGSPAASSALLTTSTGGVAPFYVGTWGAVDMIRDVYSDAKSGQVRLTALATMNLTFSRAEQLRILTGIQGS